MFSCRIWNYGPMTARRPPNDPAKYTLTKVVPEDIKFADLYGANV